MGMDPIEETKKEVLKVIQLCIGKILKIRLIESCQSP